MISNFFAEIWRNWVFVSAGEHLQILLAVFCIEVATISYLMITKIEVIASYISNSCYYYMDIEKASYFMGISIYVRPKCYWTEYCYCFRCFHLRMSDVRIAKFIDLLLWLLFFEYVLHFQLFAAQILPAFLGKFPLISVFHIDFLW